MSTFRHGANDRSRPVADVPVVAKPDGTLLGEGLSDTKENKLFYKENFVFKNSGQYKVTIQQAVRQSGKIEGIEKLDGITEVGFRIEKQE